MFDWEGRILDNKSIMMIKAALPFLDVPVGEVVDLEGLLRAIRCFCRQQEQKMIDFLLQFFMMKRMMTIMAAVGEAQNSDQGMEKMMDLLKSQIPKEQQDMFEMMSMMMSMSDTQSDAEAPAENTMSQEWQHIAENIDKGTVYGSEGHIQKHASGEGTGDSRFGAKDAGEEHETVGATHYGSDADSQSSQSFLFSGRGERFDGDSYERYEQRGKETRGNDEGSY